MLTQTKLFLNAGSRQSALPVQLVCCLIIRWIIFLSSILVLLVIRLSVEFVIYLSKEFKKKTSLYLGGRFEHIPSLGRVGTKSAKFEIDVLEYMWMIKMKNFNFG